MLHPKISGISGRNNEFGKELGAKEGTTTKVRFYNGKSFAFHPTALG